MPDLRGSFGAELCCKVVRIITHCHANFNVGSDKALILRDALQAWNMAQQWLGLNLDDDITPPLAFDHVSINIAPAGSYGRYTFNCNRGPTQSTATTEHTAIMRSLEEALVTAIKFLRTEMPYNPTINIALPTRALALDTIEFWNKEAAQSLSQQDIGVRLGFPADSERAFAACWAANKGIIEKLNHGLLMPTLSDEAAKAWVTWNPKFMSGEHK